jgi:hypothetical protein
LTHDKRLGTRIVSNRSDARERLDHRHGSGELQTTRLLHLADDEDLLASVRLDDYADLRIFQISFRQTISHLVLDRLHAEAAYFHSTEQRKRKRPVRLHHELARQLRLLVHRDGQRIIRADDVEQRLLLGTK